MSASSKKKLHAEETNVKLTEKQLAQQKEDKKVRAYTIAFAAVLVVLVVVAAVFGIQRGILPETEAGSVDPLHRLQKFV